MGDLKLKACPFCGCDATMLFEIRDDDDSTIGVAYVECRRCKARTDEEWTEPCDNGSYLFTDVFDASLKAVERWNRRANDGQ